MWLSGIRSRETPKHQALPYVPTAKGLKTRAHVRRRAQLENANTRVKYTRTRILELHQNARCLRYLARSKLGPAWRSIVGSGAFFLYSGTSPSRRIISISGPQPYCTSQKCRNIPNPTKRILQQTPNLLKLSSHVTCPFHASLASVDCASFAPLCA